jgi:hypothetical protein
MHPLPSHLAYECAQARQADLVRHRHRRMAFAQRHRPRRGAVRAMRQSTGWFLVGLGLRLAVPQPPLSSLR